MNYHKLYGPLSGALRSVVPRRTLASDAKDPQFYVSANVRLRSAQRVYPLKGIKVALLNKPSIGEFTARLLQDYGAEVTKYCEPFGGIEVEEEYGRKIDLNNGEDVNMIKNVARKVDILVDYLHGSRLEQVGLDPKEMLRTNSKLIVARITGFGQTGPLGGNTGGDTTYAALSGVMSQVQSGDEETLRISLREAKALAMAGRSNAVTGVILALYDREHTGKGQIIDVSVTESIAYVKRVSSESQLNIPPAFHRFYRTADDKYVAVGVMNPQEQKQFLQILCVGDDTQNTIAAVREAIAGRTQEEILSQCAKFSTVSEVLSKTNVGRHKQHRERESFDYDEGTHKWLARPVPKFTAQ